MRKKLLVLSMVVFFSVFIILTSGMGTLYADDFSITHVSSITGAGSPNYLDGSEGVFVSGNYAYVASSIDDALSIFDISNPSSPTHVGSIRGRGSPNYLFCAYRVFVSGNYAYVASFYDDAAINHLGLILS